MPGSSATASTRPPLIPVTAEFMNASAATFKTDVFHAHQGALAGPAHAQGLFVGDLLVGRPEGVDIAGLLGAALDELEISVDGVPG